MTTTLKLAKLYNVRKAISEALSEFEDKDDQEVLKLALSVVEFKLDCLAEMKGSDK